MQLSFTVEDTGGALWEGEVFSSSFQCSMGFVFHFAFAAPLPEASASAVYLELRLLISLQPQPIDGHLAKHTKVPQTYWRMGFRLSDFLCVPASQLQPASTLYPSWQGHCRPKALLPCRWTDSWCPSPSPCMSDSFGLPLLLQKVISCGLPDTATVSPRPCITLLVSRLPALWLSRCPPARLVPSEVCRGLSWQL